MAISQAMCTSFKVELLNGIHAFGTTVVRGATTADTFYLALYTSSATLDATTTAYTATNEVSGTGYSAGGQALTTVAPTSSGTTAFLDFDDETWTTATITARGALIYNSTQSNKAVAVLDFGGDKTSTAGDFTVVFPTADASNAIIRIAQQEVQMALVVNDRVKETTTTTGTGDITFAGAATGFETFASGIGNSNTTYYAIALQGGSEFEVGLGTLSADSSTMARTTIISSSNSDSVVNFSAGTKDVFCTLPASKTPILDASGDVTLSGTLEARELESSNGIITNNETVSADYTFPTGYNGMSVGPITIASGITVTVPSGQRWVIL